mmetsp:Transcript_14506/g.28873  ORF Transcript_14506/g.28873 Transcript_14506/m.28873 type:complete len:212 (-) Transcript_14506:123-758(-)
MSLSPSYPTIASPPPFLASSTAAATQPRLSLRSYITPPSPSSTSRPCMNTPGHASSSSLSKGVSPLTRLSTAPFFVLPVAKKKVTSSRLMARATARRLAGSGAEEPRGIRVPSTSQAIARTLGGEKDVDRDSTAVKRPGVEDSSETSEGEGGGGGGELGGGELEGVLGGIGERGRSRALWRSSSFSRTSGSYKSPVERLGLPPSSLSKGEL